MDPRVPLATAALALGLVAAAPAATSDSFRLSFSPAKAGQSAGLTESGKFDGTRIVDRLTTVLPVGTKVDTSAAPRCAYTATTTQPAMDMGGFGKVCAAGTKVATGTGNAKIGTNAAAFSLSFYNGPENVMFVDLKVGSTLAYTSSYAISGNRLTFDLGLAPKLKAKITAFSITFPKKGRGGKAYIRTPKTCPSSGRLSASVITRAAGKSQTVKTTVACKA